MWFLTLYHCVHLPHALTNCIYRVFNIPISTASGIIQKTTLKHQASKSSYRSYHDTGNMLNKLRYLFLDSSI